MKLKLILCLALVLSGGLLGCSTTRQPAGWPVFYDSEKGPEHISISREPKELSFYTNGIPDWNSDLRVPMAKITSSEVKDLRVLNGFRAIEVRLSLDDTYYTDAQVILQEIEPNLFLPVFVQDYNQGLRQPSEQKVFQDKGNLIIETGMDYEGTGHFHNRYKIIISPNHDPIVVKP